MKLKLVTISLESPVEAEAKLLKQDLFPFAQFVIAKVDGWYYVAEKTTGMPVGFGSKIAKKAKEQFFNLDSWKREKMQEAIKLYPQINF